MAARDDAVEPGAVEPDATEPDATESGLIDWDAAHRSARRLTPAGPAITPDEAVSAVESMRQELTGGIDFVTAVTGRPLQGDQVVAEQVVDRPTWAKHNIESFRTVLEPGLQTLQAKRAMGPRMGAAAGRLTAAQLGTVIAVLSTRVLGQFDPYRPDAPTVLLVAPNIVALERKLDVNPTDFRRWVAVHEQTHRWQFDQAPWLRTWMWGRIELIMAEMVGSTGDTWSSLRQMLSKLPDALRGNENLIDAWVGPGRRELLGELTAVMTLLEGHADVVMDDVGAQHIPTVSAIRTAFDGHRNSMSAMNLLLRRGMGLGAKYQQYAAGAAFIRGVLECGGMDLVNQVWESPDRLPTLAEIDQPELWVARIS